MEKEMEIKPQKFVEIMDLYQLAMSQKDVQIAKLQAQLMENKAAQIQQTIKSKYELSDDAKINLDNGLIMENYG